MSTIPLLALPSGLEVTAFSRQEGMLCVSLLSTQPAPRCPVCGSPATRIHSRYQRRLADLPAKNLHERLTPFVAPRARVTGRLFQIVQIIGLATGGRLGVRVTDRLGIQTSRVTILRRIMALPAEPVGQVVQLGIDDFSFKRGRTFGNLYLKTEAITDLGRSK